MKNVMSWIDKIKAISVISISSFLGFFIIEYSYSYIKGNSSNDSFINRTMLFETGHNFINHKGYFKYFPNAEIRNLTLYSKSDPKSIGDIEIAYDYLIRTNNMGLVMQADVIHNDRVIFVIGDSFTEGQGASPWFYDLEKSYENPKEKIVNLGILGTGPQQWENLALAISGELKLDVRASVVNIVPDDMLRGVWVLAERELDCLYHALCDYKFGFQGYNFKPQESYDDIKLSVLNTLSESTGNLGEKSYFDVNTIKNFIKRSSIIRDIYRSLYKKNHKDQELNEDSLLALNKAVNGNLYVNVVSQKTINSTNFTSYRPARELIDFLKEHGIKYSWCDIPIDGYHRYDPHPNANGYKVVRSCTKNSLEKLD